RVKNRGGKNGGKEEEVTNGVTSRECDSSHENQRIHSSFAHRSYQWMLTSHSHRSLQKLLCRSQRQLLLCLRFAVRKGSSHTPHEIPRAQTRSLSFSFHDFEVLCIFPFGYSLTVYAITNTNYETLCFGWVPLSVVMLRVMLIVQKLLQENKHSSKRDIYYTYPSLFLDQSVVDQAINDICILMQCSRHNLNVVVFCSIVTFFVIFLWFPQGMGTVLRLMDRVCLCCRLTMGWIRFSEGERKFDCISSPNSVHPVPVHVEEVKDIISVAQYILVVEKESVFQRLANDQFCNANHCIVITGRGYPDIPTRRFLRLLVENLRLPVYCLVDCDPYGFDILTTYRFGSMQMAYDTKHLRVPEIRWLGAFPSDSERYFVPKQCILPLTAEVLSIFLLDKRKVEAMLLRCYLQREVPQWRFELKLMLQKGVKFEIEALSAHALSFLSDSYIPSKIERKLIM
ncbi:hypothetical protein V8G54_037161, partial [Vigna mungo]